MHDANSKVDSYNMAVKVTDSRGNSDKTFFKLKVNQENISQELLDINKWSYELGYVRNGETQRYTKTNAQINDGILALKAKKASDGSWTSSSIISHGHFAFMYGKIEARIKCVI